MFAQIRAGLNATKSKFWKWNANTRLFGASDDWWKTKLDTNLTLRHSVILFTSTVCFSLGVFLAKPCLVLFLLPDRSILKIHLLTESYTVTNRIHTFTGLYSTLWWVGLLARQCCTWTCVFVLQSFKSISMLFAHSCSFSLALQMLHYFSIFSLSSFLMVWSLLNLVCTELQHQGGWPTGDNILKDQVTFSFGHNYSFRG